MGADEGKTAPGINQTLDPKGPLPSWVRAKCELFQAILLLERLFPASPGLGGSGPASKERVRLRPSTSLAFPISDIAEADWCQAPATGEDRARLTTNLFGLVGTTSPLPMTYVEEVLLNEEDAPQLRAFLDIFHHRLLSLLYRVWVTHRYEYTLEAGALDPLSRTLLSLIGVSSDKLEADPGLPPERLLRYLGLFLVPGRPAEGLQTLLSAEFGVTVEVVQLESRWVRLPPELRFKLRNCPTRKGKVGKHVRVGTRIRDCAGSIRLRLGPLTHAQLDQFEPGTEKFRRLVALARFYIRQPLDIVLECIAPASDKAASRLTRAAPARVGRGTLLGRPRRETVVQTYEVPA